MSRDQKKARARRIERDIDERIAKLPAMPRGFRRKELARIVKLRTEATGLAA